MLMQTDHYLPQLRCPESKQASAECPVNGGCTKKREGLGEGTGLLVQKLAVECQAEEAVCEIAGWFCDGLNES